MADNYLERKMEDLRNGKISAGISGGSQGASPRNKKGMLNFFLPEKRILVVGTQPAQLIKDICGDFSRNGCKVSLFSDDTIPIMQGIRHYHCLDDLSMAFANLLKAWRDIDVMILADASVAEALLPLWSAHKDAYPIPSDYGGRVITFGESPVHLAGTLRDAGITSNCILISTDINLPEVQSKLSECIRRTLLYIALPTSKCLNHTTLKLS